MREIKFRAWSPTFGKWREDWSISVYGAVLDLNAERLDDDLILCQYTGLTDKNGKEIYEGDVCSMQLEGTVVVGRVEYVPPGFRLCTSADAWDLDNYYELEAIGNIYENPELLGGKE